ncbi:MAG: Ribulose-phosphate 3-epimerase [Chlamydiales bacterium]|nr:Ribulose-phosphate 3-epimerase [Chlamydiales bacterium]
MSKQEEILIAPSILAADFGHIADEAKRIEEAGADAIHVDIMDGHFVPNLTLGPKALSAINRATELFLDVHIMIYNPYEYIESLVEAGADRITFHFEATEGVEDTLKFIRRCGIQAGLAFRPETSVEFAVKYLTHCDLILMMTVPPGFGGQQFHHEIVDKVRLLRETCDQFNIREGGQIPKKGETLSPFLIEVDGGVDAQTAPLCIEAGANVLVAGTYLFKEKDLAKGIQELRGYGDK